MDSGARVAVIDNSAIWHSIKSKRIKLFKMPLLKISAYESSEKNHELA